MPTYSFLDTNVAITGPGGSFTIGGQGAANADEGITASMTEDKNTLTTGAGGEAMNSLHAASAGRFTIRLLKTSPVNAQLSSLYNIQSNSSALWGQNTIVLKNAVSGDSITGALCAFKKFPDQVYDKEGRMNEWEFDVGVMNMNLGGNGTAASITAALASNLPLGSV